MSNFPEPITPIDCDLRGLPFMQLDVTRLVDSDLFALSTGEEFKAAVALWCKSWLQVPAASLPDDDRVLAHLSGAGTRWKKLKTMALRGWIRCSDGRLYHPTVAEKALHAWKARTNQRERAAKRWNKKDQEQGNATASEDDMPRHSHGTSQGNAIERERERESISSLRSDNDPSDRVEPVAEPDQDGSNIVPIPAPSPLQPQPGVPVVRAVDPRQALFSIGLTTLRGMTGKPADPCRKLIGKWLRELRDDCAVLNLVLLEAAETRPADPVAWISGAVRSRAGGKITQTQRDWGLDDYDLDANAAKFRLEREAGGGRR